MKYWTVVLIASAVSIPAQAGPCLAFPTPGGKIVSQSATSTVRLIEARGAPAEAEAVFLVKGTPRRCFEVITDLAAYPEFMPNMIHTAPAGPGAPCDWDFTLKVAAWKLRYRLKFSSAQSDSALRFSWTYVKGDLSDSRGQWTIGQCSEKPGHSVVHYSTVSKPAVVAPRWVIDQLTTRSIPGLIDAVRRRVESGVACTMTLPTECSRERK